MRSTTNIFVFLARVLVVTKSSIYSNGDPVCIIMYFPLVKISQDYLLGDTPIYIQALDLKLLHPR